MNSTNSIKQLLIVCVLGFTLSPKVAWADGVMMKSGKLGDWEFFSEERQSANITYDAGIEKMFLNVDVKMADSSSIVWIFPVPAAPDKVSIDVSAENQRYYGEKLSSLAKKRFSEIRSSMLYTQLYPISPPWSRFRGGIQGLIGGAASHLGASGGNDGGGVQVHAHLEKEGMVTEVVTASKGSDIYAYLRNSGLKVEDGAIKVLDHYISKDFSFVVSRILPQEIVVSTREVNGYFRRLPRARKSEWPAKVAKVYDQKLRISPEGQWWSLKHYQSRDLAAEIVEQISKDPSVVREVQKEIASRRLVRKGVLVSFPTKEIFFPLLLTSVYGEKVVPLTVNVVGLVSPVIFREIKQFAKVDYYSGRIFRYRSLRDPIEPPIEYTSIKVDAPSKNYTQDLRILPHVPLAPRIFKFISQNKTAIFGVLLVVISVLSGIIVGWVIYPGLRNLSGLWRISLIGLCNLGSIVGVFFAAKHLLPKYDYAQLGETLSALRDRGYFFKMRFRSVLSMFIVLTALTSFVSYMDYSVYGNDTVNVLSVIAALGLAVPILIAKVLSLKLGEFLVAFGVVGGYLGYKIWRGLRIKPDDRALFLKLAESNYSRTLLPYGKTIEFAYNYTITFVVLACLTTWGGWWLISL